MVTMVVKYTIYRTDFAQHNTRSKDDQAAYDMMAVGLLTHSIETVVL